jgi:hypothetical protein
MSLLRRVGGGTLAVVLVVGASALVGCGGAMASREPASASVAPASEAEAPLDTLANAEAALAQRQVELDTLFPTPGGGEAAPSVELPAASGTTTPAPAPPAAPADQPLQTDRKAERAATGSASRSSDDRCARACKAFASLSRAADAVCRLSEEKERCERARRVRDENAKRVAVCGCG